MPVLDTAASTLERQREAFRRMTPERRLAIAAEMSDEARAIAEAGIRRRNPGYSDDQVRKALVRILVEPPEAERASPRHSPPVG
jgi:hypothetical protein